MQLDSREEERLKKLKSFEMESWRQGFKHIAGVDEAGRGSLAGPLVACAVILPKDSFISGIGDSKKLTSKKRESLYEHICKEALELAIGIVKESEIDQMKIQKAALLAMERAVAQLKRVDFLLIDGVKTLSLPIPQLAIVKGDSKSYSIAAASIIAKVTRDRMMKEYDEIYHEYGFSKHKGYGTSLHAEAIKKYGPCSIHRKSFKLW